MRARSAPARVWKGRMMQKSIFRRYLAITMGIVVLSFVMLGSVMMIFFSRYWQGRKKTCC